jgi:hypothetical protein
MRWSTVEGMGVKSSGVFAGKLYSRMVCNGLLQIGSRCVCNAVEWGSLVSSCFGWRRHGIAGLVQCASVVQGVRVLMWSTCADMCMSKGAYCDA